MRIAMVGPFGLHPNKTMHSRALNLALALVRRGHKVAMLMPPWQTPEEAERRWSIEGVEMYYVSLRYGPPGIAMRLVRQTLAWKPDIVHSFKPKAYSGLVAWWLWQFHRARLKLVTDSDDWEGWGGWNDRAPYTTPQKHFFAWQERWGMGHCHALTVASRTLQSIAWSRGVPVDRAIYLPNGAGIDERAAVPAERVAAHKRELGLAGRPVLLLYSRLFEFSTERLVHILAAVREALPAVALLTIGESLYAGEGARLRDQLAEARLLPAVVELGWMEPESLPLHLALADAGLYLMDDTLLNRAKCPVKLADQLALGIPMVGEAVGQVPEYILPGLTGFLRPAGDVAGLSRDVAALLQDETLRAAMRAAAAAHYQATFSWDRQAGILEAVYAAGR